MKSFRELDIWVLAMDLVDRVYELINRFPSDERFALCDQLRRAVVSVPSNIAEGFGRESHRDFAHFLVQARGSLYEIETQLEIAVRRGYVDGGDLPSIQLNNLSKMISSLIRTLRDKPDFAQGTKHTAQGTPSCPQSKGTRAYFRAFVLCLLSFVLPLAALAAPFAQWFPGTSPKGVAVRVWGEGDEYSIRYEAEDGHAVVKDPDTRKYFYARQEADGALVSTGIAVGDETDADRMTLAAIPLHQRDTSSAAREARRARIDRDESETSRRARWAKQKETMRKLREAKKSGVLMAPPSRTTLGTVKGLTILIDFPIEGSGKTTWSSVHPGVTADQLDELLNGENCSLYGNYSSVHSYYHDASNGRLDYSMVVIGPITAPQPRSHYDDPKRDNGECALELIGDVFNIIWNDANFSTKYLPVLRSLTTQDGYIRSLNIWFAGESATEWSFGLWAHKWAVGSTISGTYTFKDDNGTTVRFGNYQITPITSAPGIYTFCHENGHMLCDFPDLYNYESSISGNRGVGYFSLMYGSADKANPPYFDAYLRTAAGWVEPQLLPSAGGTVTVRNNHTDVWKYENPKDPSEYYLIENRQKTGRDASIRGSGILIWRCYEWGDNCHPEPTAYLSGFASGVYRWNYELSLEQADGNYDIERGLGYGDAYDTWYQGNSFYKSTDGQKGVFSDGSLPTAKWADASDSGLKLSGFSANGDTMTFTVAAYTPASPDIPLATALDNDRLAFLTGGDERWYGQTAKTTTGGSAARSGAIGNSSGSWFKAVVEGPGELAFDWMVSSERNYDFLDFSVDGEVQEKISGTTSWATKSFQIAAGEHVLVWTYSKDGSSRSGDDAGYVDHIVWTPDSESVAAPEISGPKTEVFVAPAEVILTCATAGATIRYTLDGSEPTESSALYERPIVITGDVTVKARAFVADKSPSAIAEATYLLKAEPGVWTDDAERVRLSAAIDGQMVCVLLGRKSSSNWSSFENVAYSDTFRSWAAANGVYLVLYDYDDASSPAKDWFYDLEEQDPPDTLYIWQMYFAAADDLDTPIGSGCASNGVAIGSVTYARTIDSLIAGFASVMSANGMTPTAVAVDVAAVLGTSGLEWQNDSNVAWREEHPGKMVAGGLKDSVAANYTSTLRAVAPGRGTLRFKWKAVIYSGNNVFTFKVGNTTKITKRYENSTSDYEGSEEFTVASDAGETFEWTYKVGSYTYDYSGKCVWLYDVVWTPAPVATPVIEGPEVALIDGSRDVTVTCATAGATIFYTLDGSDPTEESRIFSGTSIRLTGDATLKVRAYKEGMGPSEVVTARFLTKAAVGAWTDDAERARLSAAVEGRMICVAKLNESLAAWSTLGPILTGERFRSWAAANGIYLVRWDSQADSSGTSASATWFKDLYAQRGTGSMYNWEMCFARPSAPDTLCGYARAYDGYSVGSVKYDKTASGLIAGFASVLYDNGLTPTPVIAAAEIGSYLQTSGLTWRNDSPLSWRDETVDQADMLRAGGFKATAHTSTLSATATGRGTLTFAYKAVSSSAENKFLFRVNGRETLDCHYTDADTASGTETVAITDKGGATFEWICSVGSAKDATATTGAWISDVMWTPNDLEAVSPSTTEANPISLLTGSQRSYLYDQDHVSRDKNVKTAPDYSGGSPVTLSWTGSEGPFTVTVRKLAGSVAEGTVVWADTVSGNSASVANLEIGAGYEWTVTDARQNADSAVFHTSPDAPRLIKAGTMSALRDLGGWTGLQGCKVRQNQLFRGGPASGIDDEAKTFFHDVVGLKTELDFRGESSDRLNVDGVTYVPLSRDDQYRVLTTTVNGRSGMSQAHWQNLIDSFKAIFDKTRRPAYFHCTYGKDRTGVTAALILALLGVSTEDIWRDYQCTPQSSPIIDADSYFQGYLHDMATVMSGYGTFQEQVEAYFIEKLGFTRKQIEDFREEMLIGYVRPGGRRVRPFVRATWSGGKTTFERVEE